VNAALILAAGESRRMGRPKALLEYQGETFLNRLIGLFQVRCSPVIVVLGAHADEIRSNTRDDVRFIINHRYRDGQTTSMQCGLHAVPPEAEGVLFSLVDHPAITAHTVDALLDGQSGPLLRVPRYDGRRGHPVWFSATLIAEFLALPADGAARDVVRKHFGDTAFLDIDDPGILADIDDPAAYLALTGATP